jgi:hypothetical protein
MKVLKLDPMLVLVLVVALGVVVTMSTQASMRKASDKTAIAMSDTAVQLEADDTATTASLLVSAKKSQQPL